MSPNRNTPTMTKVHFCLSLTDSAHATCFARYEDAIAAGEWYQYRAELPYTVRASCPNSWVVEIEGAGFILAQEILH